MQEEMKQAREPMPGACLLCGARKHTAVYDFDGRDIVRCDRCGFTYVHPMPEEGYFHEVYSSDYWGSYQVSVGEKDIHERLNEFLEISRERIEFLARFKTEGRLLDVGCAMGFLVKAAQDAGFEACGIDLSEKTLAEGRQRYGVQLHRGVLGDYPLSQFDVITSYNTIEHVTRPDLFLKEIRKRLVHDGIAVIGTHDIDCGTHRALGRAWKHIMPEEHLYYFRLEDMERLSGQCGLETLWHNKPIDNLIVSYHRRHTLNANS